MSAVAWLETETNVVFVGEPTGQRPNLCSEPTLIRTPHGDFRVEVSRYRWVHTWP